MSKKFRLLMALTLVIGLFGGLMTASTVSADPEVGDIIEIPRIDVGDTFGTGTWDTWIQIQNVTDCPTTVTVDFYGGDPFLCPPNADGVLGTRTMWMPGNGVWTLHNAIPAGAESAFVTHIPDSVDCDADLAVTVDRLGPDAQGFDFTLSSSYTGIADDTSMVGEGPPYKYFAPYIMNEYHDLDTTLAIQNSGDICASIWIYYKNQGNCECMKAQHIEQVAPGETVFVGPGPDADYDFPGADECSPGNGDWLGSAYITANVPLAIAVDQLSLTGEQEGVFLTYRGMPYNPLDSYDPDERDELDLGVWDTRWYADLLYREISGWQSSIQVQNLTEDSQPTFVTVEFFDQSGDSILFIGDWICRNGAETFFLPAIVDLGVNFPFGYVGAAEIQSHVQVDYPGDDHGGEPIFVIVDMKKVKRYDSTVPGWIHTEAGETQGGAYNAHPEAEKRNADMWAMPYIAKEQDGVTSRIAIRNNANCNKITGTIYIYDETGVAVGTIPVPYLHPKHMKIFDLNYMGNIAKGFTGAAVFVVDVPATEQLCDIDNNGHVDNADFMPSVVVLNYGWGVELSDEMEDGPLTTEGDLTRVYEAIPFSTLEKTCYGDIFGDVYYYDFEAERDDPEANEPVVGAAVTVDTGEDDDVTSASGGYELMRISEGLRTVTASKAGFFWTQSEEVDLECGADTKLDILMVCENTLTGTVTDEATGVPLEGVLVELDISGGTLDRTYDLEDTTAADGTWEITVPLVDSAWTLTMSKDGYSDRVYSGLNFAINNGYETEDCFDGVEDSTDYETALISHAYIQGKVFCDGLVDDDGVFNPGEEQAGVLVRLYADIEPDGDGDIWEQSYTTGADGFYQFVVSLDRLPADPGPDGVVDSIDYTVVAWPTESTAGTMTADEHRVINIDICTP